MKKDMIIVYDDFSAMPLQVSFLNGDWWLTTPGERLQPLDDYLDDDNVFNGIHSYLCDYQLEGVGDFERISSWGVVSENGEESLAIIDFGLSDEIFDQYYRRKAMEQ